MSSSSSSAADEEGTAEFVAGWLGWLSRAFVDFVRLAFAMPLVLGVAVLGALLGWLPLISNFSRVPAATSWSILRVWRVWANLESVRMITSQRQLRLDLLGAKRSWVGVFRSFRHFLLVEQGCGECQ